MRGLYAVALYDNPGATLDDLREAVTTLEDLERTARRVLGGTHPTTLLIRNDVEYSRGRLRAREWGPLFLAFAVAVVAWGVWHARIINK